ncbi:MAG: hypothetical protein LBL98_08030 [Ruminococcus sp.]|jgi:hypothetical protein|nr:hypothetical protein [Ruminococcus sp.]
MKKETLIKLAAERGITLNEEQAESYINLTDEELENIAGAGKYVKDLFPIYGTEANRCNSYKPKEYDETDMKCCYCEFYITKTDGCGNWNTYCWNESASR